jgi:Mn-containing catalase
MLQLQNQAKDKKSMFFSDPRLAYPVRVDKPNPIFAKMLQQAIGGIEGEIRVMLQYLFQAWGFRGPTKYRDMLYNTGTEEIGHIEMLATAVAMNLEGAPMKLKEEIASQNPAVEAVLGGQSPRHVLSTGLAALASDSEGVPFNGSWIIGSGNLVADMHANVAAESTGRLLVTRLWEMTDDPGMKDTLGFLIARDTMHQNQWLAVLEEIEQPYPVPSDFPQNQEKHEFSYDYFMQSTAPIPENSRFAQGKSIDGKGEFRTSSPTPMGPVPELAPAPKESHTSVMMKSNFKQGMGQIVSETAHKVAAKITKSE